MSDQPNGSGQWWNGTSPTERGGLDYPSSVPSQPPAPYSPPQGHQPAPAPQPALPKTPGSNTKWILAGIVALVVAIGAGVATVLVLRDDGPKKVAAEGGGPEKLSAEEYVDQLCEITDPIVTELPSVANIDRVRDPESFDELREYARHARDLWVGVRKLGVAEHTFSESFIYDGVGGEELRDAISAGYDKFRGAVDKGIASLDRLSAAIDEITSVENPTPSQVAEYQAQVADIGVELSRVARGRQELPGAADELFAGVQYADEPPSGDLEDALVTLGEAAESNSECTSALTYGE